MKYYQLKAKRAKNLIFGQIEAALAMTSIRPSLLMRYLSRRQISFQRDSLQGFFSIGQLVETFQVSSTAFLCMMTLRLHACFESLFTELFSAMI